MKIFMWLIGAGVSISLISFLTSFIEIKRSGLMISIVVVIVPLIIFWIINKISRKVPATSHGEAIIWLFNLIFVIAVTILLWLISTGFGWGATDTEELVGFLIPLPGIIYIIALVYRIKKKKS